MIHTEAVTFRQKRTKGASFIRTVPLMYVLSNADEFEVENRDFIPVFPLFIISFCSIVALALCRTKYADVREINDFCSKSGNLQGVSH